MKKILLILLALLLVFCVSCKDEEGSTDASSQESSSQSSTEDSSTESSAEDSSTEPATPIYTVTWHDETGAILGETEVEEGSVPTYTYTKTDTAEWDYTVDGWSPSQNGTALSVLPAVTADADYYAVVSRVKRSYTVTFETDGGSAIAPVTVLYGETVGEPEDPEKADHRFVDWCTDTTYETAVTWPLTVTGNVTVYAKWNQQVDITAYLTELLDGYKLNPMSYLPESMRYDFESNLIDPDDLVTDYSSFVNVSDIMAHGHGEQWAMIMDNIQQSMTFFNVLTAVEGLTSTSIAAFNNYIDQNPGDTAEHTFLSGIYTVTIKFDGETMYYILDYTADIPVIGETAVQIAMDMDIATKTKTVRVQLGDPNALKYTVTENSYNFAIKYAGVRRAYFSVERNADGTVEGHIYEHLEYSGVGTHSAAEFYIDDAYVTAVGSKADAYLGAAGYIVEVYSVETGRLLGYEVRETSDVPLIGEVTFNTLWFDLDDIDGLTSIKYRPYVAATETEAAIPAAFFVNGKSTEWANKTVGGFGAKMASRRYDLEFRTQYFYAYDATENVYVRYAVQVPMLFVQEENLETFTADVKSKNSGVTLTVAIDTDDFARIQDEYDTKVDGFIENKDLWTSDTIIAHIGNKITFEE